MSMNLSKPKLALIFSACALLLESAALTASMRYLVDREMGGSQKIQYPGVLPTSDSQVSFLGYQH